MAGDVLPSEEADIPCLLPGGKSCSGGGHCETLRSSRRLPSDLSSSVAPHAEELVVSAALLLARKYSNSLAFRMGIRGASWSAADGCAQLSSSMPSDLAVVQHRHAVAAELARITKAPGAGPDLCPKLICVLGGPADGRFDADLAISSEVTPLGIVIHADFHPHVYPAEFVGRLLGHFENLLRQSATDQAVTIGELQLLTDAERRQWMQFNRTGSPYPRDASIYEVFAAQAAAGAERVAIRHQEESVTYGELNQQVLQLAGLLREQGVGRHSRVAFMLDKSPLLMVAVLAILRLGGAYVPIDSADPAARQEFLLADSGAELLLTDRAPVPAPVPVIDLTALPGGMPDALPPQAAASPTDAAYVLYTSGTTGRPKGVVVPQRAVVRLVRGIDYADLSPGTRMLQSGAIGFDATTFEFWGPLLNGGTLVLVPSETVLSSVDLRAALTRHGVNSIVLTSSLFNQLVEQDPSVLTGCQVLVGGETLSPRHVAIAMDACQGSVFINVYGPTENTTFSATHRIDRRYLERIPIGRPIANSTTWVMDRDGNPQPADVPGELFLGGDGLCDGYLNRPDLNEKAFTTGGVGPAERLYRSGDIALWNSDGLLEIIGRTDNQVKIRGHRVELGEIENQLSRLPDVHEAAVVLCEDADGISSLCAFLTADDRLDESDIRRTLLRQLPDYMVPSVICQIDELPWTANQKLDRSALAAMRPADTEMRAGTKLEPRTPVETRVAAIFSDVLDVPSVSVDDDFFELGGHSLRVMRLWSRIRAEFGVEVELREVLDSPTVSSIASIVERAPVAGTVRPKLVRQS